MTLVPIYAVTTVKLDYVMLAHTPCSPEWVHCDFLLLPNMKNSLTG